MLFTQFILLFITRCLLLLWYYLLDITIAQRLKVRLYALAVGSWSFHCIAFTYHYPISTESAQIQVKRVTAHYAFNAVHSGTDQQARFTGSIEVDVMTPNYHTMRRISAEVGSDYFRRHWREIRHRLSRRQKQLGQQYCGVWLGGIIDEDYSPTPGRAHNWRFIRFAVDGDTQRRAAEMRNRLPEFRRDELATLALSWLQELDTQRQLQLQVKRNVLREFERELVDKYGGCTIYEIYHSTLKGWLKVRFGDYMCWVMGMV
ncbi:hypothetical protein MIR68_001690 [Amoeboaphelidium protococcarum]|nr:hypothetical protein MIR68_001690 [Amoeboaphelidium protococcarum]